METIEHSQRDQEQFNRLALQLQMDSMPTGASAAECEDCGEEIPKGRQKAAPGCTRCIGCQDRYERNQRRER